MGAPQIIVIVWIAVVLGMSLEESGGKKGYRNFWASLLTFSALTGLLYWGGFFS